VQVDWLNQVKIESGFSGAPNIILRAEASECDGMNRPLSFGLCNNFVTASIGKSDIAQQHIDLSRADDLQRSMDVIRSQNFMTEMREQAGQSASRIAVVFYEQDAQRLGWTSRRALSAISLSEFRSHRLQRHLESGTKTPATALRFNCAAVKLDQVF